METAQEINMAEGWALTMSGLVPRGGNAARNALHPGCGVGG